MARKIGGYVCVSGRRRSAVATVIAVLLMVAAAGTTGLAQVSDALPFAKGFLLTGNYVVGSVDLDPKTALNGFVSGTIPISPRMAM